MDKDKERKIVEQLLAGTFQFEATEEGVTDAREFVQKLKAAMPPGKEAPVLDRIEARLMDSEFRLSEGEEDLDNPGDDPYGDAPQAPRII